MSIRPDVPARRRPSWLVVGASGRVAGLVRAAWRIAPPSADVTCQFRRAAPSDNGLVWSPLDGPETLVEWCRSGHGFDAMIFLAGVVRERHGTTFADDPRIADAALAAAAAAEIPRCLVASSSAVYGPAKDHPHHEEDPTHPTTPYGRAKLVTEHVCARWRGRGLEVTALRIGNVAGAESLLGQVGVRDHREILLDQFPDGSGPVRSYIDPMTLAAVLETLAATDSLPPMLNVAAPGEVAMSDLLDAAGLTWGWRSAPEGAIRRVVLDTGRLASIHAFPPDASAPERIVAGWRAACAA